MKFSVVIPLYNKEASIEKTIQTVLSQTVQDFEIVVVDDGSTDRGAQIVEKMNCGKIRLIRQRNQGVSAARNTGIREAKGEYVCFLDADDLWNRDYLAAVSRLIDEFPEASVYCSAYEVKYIDKAVVPNWKSVDLEKDGLVHDFFEMATGSFWVTHSSNTTVKKAELQKMDKLFPVGETCYEDFDFWLRLGSRCKVAFSNQVCASYIRITENNARTTHSGKIVYSRSYMRTLNEFLYHGNLTREQKQWVKEIRDRRMVPFVFSLLLCDKNEKAREELSRWQPDKKYRKYKWGLQFASFLPHPIIRKTQEIRYKMF